MTEPLKRSYATDVIETENGGTEAFVKRGRSRVADCYGSEFRARRIAASLNAFSSAAARLDVAGGSAELAERMQDGLLAELVERLEGALPFIGYLPPNPEAIKKPIYELLARIRGEKAEAA